MSDHLGTSYRSIGSAFWCGRGLLPLSKDNLDFSGTSYLPACGTGKEIELVCDEVGRMGWWSICWWAGLGFRGTWAGWRNGPTGATWSSTEAKEKPCPRARVRPCSRNQRGTRKSMADRSGSGRGALGAGAHLARGEDRGTALVWLGEGETPWLPANTWWERREKTVSQLWIWPRAGQGLGQMTPFPPKFVWVRDSKFTGWLCWSMGTGVRAAPQLQQDILRSLISETLMQLHTSVCFTLP